MYEHVLTDELKSQAFKMVLEKRICQNTIKSIVQIFKCDTRLELMEELIKESIRQNKFKEVSNRCPILKIFCIACCIND